MTAPHTQPIAAGPVTSGISATAKIYPTLASTANNGRTGFGAMNIMSNRTATIIGSLLWMLAAMVIIFFGALYIHNAHAQIVPGPNISPSGIPYTFAPRFGYLGPPAAFLVPVAPPPMARGGPQPMPTFIIPREPPPRPPMRQLPPPLAQAHPNLNNPPAASPRLRLQRSALPYRPVPGAPFTREKEDAP